MKVKSLKNILGAGIITFEKDHSSAQLQSNKECQEPGFDGDPD